MQPKLNNLCRTVLVVLVATLTSGIMVSTAVSASPQPLLTAAQQLAGPLRDARRLPHCSIGCRVGGWIVISTGSAGCRPTYSPR